jgi:tRNA pseudouridine55 synthase
VQLALHVSSGTYVRAIAHALGGHCTSLRRTAVGPFEVEEATSVEDALLVPAGQALGRLDGAALERVPSAVRAGVLALEAAQGATPGGSAA